MPLLRTASCKCNPVLTLQTLCPGCSLKVRDILRVNCKWVSFGLFNQVQDLLKLWLTATGETGQMPPTDWESELVCRSSREPLTLFPITCEYLCVGRKMEQGWGNLGSLGPRSPSGWCPTGYMPCSHTRQKKRVKDPCQKQLSS